jgi:hypothetical protein
VRLNEIGWMVGGDTDGGVAGYMVVGKRGGREKFGAERGGKLEKAGWLACGLAECGRTACGLLGSGLGFAKSQFQKEWAFRVSVRVLFFSLKKKKTIGSESKPYFPVSCSCQVRGSCQKLPTLVKSLSKKLLIEDY